MTGELLTGLLLFAWCAAVVGTIDNILRPILVGKDARMPDLLILVGTLGGLFLFGPIGFIVGPIVCGLIPDRVGYLWNDLQRSPAAG